MDDGTPDDSNSGVTAGNVGGDFSDNIIAGRDIIAQIVNTGDHNRFFIGDYEHLRDAYIKPWRVFGRVQLQNFVGREWLVTEIDAFLQNHDCGFFILEANAGLGKTAFMAWLVKQRGFIHHFCEEAPGPERIGDSLKSLAAQLAVAYQLRPDGVLPSDAARRPDYLYDLLMQAANQRRSGEKIVIVVDALDEAGTPLNQNVLNLPDVLPEGVYFIASYRPGAVTLRVDQVTTPLVSFPLLATSDENQADMRSFLAQAVTRPGIVHALRDSGQIYTAEQLIATLLDKCGGVWIYLRFVVYEIEHSEPATLNLEALPHGMSQYYARYWQRWRDPPTSGDQLINPRWYKVYRPLLTMLAAAREPVTIEQLARWAAVDMPLEELRILFDGHWSAFLVADRDRNPYRYRFYHATLQEFFSGQVRQGAFSPAERALVDELSTETRRSHQRLAERYLESWGGLQAGLPGLQTAQLRDLDDRYGLHYLAVHLAAGDRGVDLHSLLRTEWLRTEATSPLAEGTASMVSAQVMVKGVHHSGYCNTWYSVREAVGQTDGYLADVMSAWHLAEKAATKVLHGGVSHHTHKKGTQLDSIGLQCRYALIVASANSLALNLLPDLLIEVVKKQVWLPQQGLSYARNIPDSRQRVEALAKLAPYFSPNEGKKILQEALRTAQAIKDKYFRAQALSDLTQHLAVREQQKIIIEAVRTAQSIEDSNLQGRALGSLSMRLMDMKQPKEALRTAQSIEDRIERSQTLAQIAVRMAELGRPEKAFAIVQSIKTRSIRAKAMTRLVPHLSGRKLQEAVRTVQSVTDDDFQAEVLIILAPYLSAAQLYEAFLTAQSIEDSDSQARALTKLAAHFAELGLLQEALRASQCINDSSARARALADLAPRLPAGEQQEVLQNALSVAQSINDRLARTRALADLAPRLPAGEQQEVLENALSIARSIEDKTDRARALINITTAYAESGAFPDALSTAESIEYSSDRAYALSNLASRMVELGQPTEALRTAQKIRSRSVRARVLAKLAPHLSAVQLQEALRLAQSIEDSSDRAQSLANLSVRLADLGQMQDALSLIQNIEDSSARARALADLAPRLPTGGQQEMLQNALSTARSVEDSTDRAWVLINIATAYAELGAFPDALSTARSVEDSTARARALADLAPRLPAGEQQEVLLNALSTARSIEDSTDRARALINIATAYAELGAFPDALSVAQSIDDSTARARTLADLAFRMAELGQYEEALPIALRIEDSLVRVQILADLAQHLPAGEQQEILRDALLTVEGMNNSYLRSQALTKLAVKLAQLGQPHEALRSARSIKDGYLQTAALADLIPYFPAVEHRIMIQEALHTAQTINDSSDRTHALLKVAFHLSGGEQEQILHDAQRTADTIKDSYFRAQGLMKLATCLAELGQPGEALFTAQRIEDSATRAQALISIAPQLVKLAPRDLHGMWCRTLPALSSRTRSDLLSDLAAMMPIILYLGGGSAVVETAQAIEDVGRWWP